MEKIIDEIMGLQNMLECQLKVINNISSCFSTKNKQNEIFLKTIRKKIKTDEEIMKKKRQRKSVLEQTKYSEY